MRPGFHAPEKEAAIKARICALASGSKGNCTYFEGGSTRVLIDAGLTMRETVRRLGLIGVEPEGLNAIIITHEHVDHVRGAGPLGRALGVPVYISSGTYGAASAALGERLSIRMFEPGAPFEIDDIYVETFSIPHDAAEPVGLCLRAGTRKVGVATDMGYATRLAVERLKGSDVLLLESNHDPRMLKEGPYPWALKQRVAGNMGHLSNPDACRMLEALLHPGLKNVVLAHLSQVNNLPELAYSSARDALLKHSLDDVGLDVACQDTVGRVIEAGN